MRTWLRSWVDSLAVEDEVTLILALTIVSSEDQAIADQFCAHLTGPHEDLVQSRLGRGRAAGQLPGPSSTRTIAQVVVGSLLYRVLNRQGVPSGDDVDALVRLALPAPPSESD